MFFSIIIPTYNPKKYLPKIFQSILSNKCKDEIEIILSDDLSTEPFDDVVSQYSNLHIRIIKNDKHYGFPRPGRQNGLDAAKGQWICFQDQDDTFCENTFDEVLMYIKNNNIHNALYTDLQFIHTDGSIIPLDAEDIFTHGKFFEKIFLKKYNINYDPVRYSEDINFTYKIIICFICNRIIPGIWHKVFYNWMQEKTSLSHDTSYYLKCVPDTIYSFFHPITEALKLKDLDVNQIYELYDIVLHNILNIYFYSQIASTFEDRQIFDKYIKEIFIPYVKIFITTLDLDITELKEALTSNKMEYTIYRNIVSEQYLFIEYITFYDWMDKYFALLV